MGRLLWLVFFHLMGLAIALKLFGYRVFLFGALVALSYCYLLEAAKAQTTNPVEVSALTAIRSKMVDPRNNLMTWSRGDPCTSNWTGVLCFSSTLGDGYLHVKELLLLNLNLSGNLAPELGQLSYLKILDVMWNQLNGSIPRQIGNIKTLELLLLNGNQLSGSIPEELGYLPNIDRIQIDQNSISGQIPESFALLSTVRHLHMNNNSLSGQIPRELSHLSNLLHLFLDNNNLTGYLPPEFSRMPKLRILQLDNNNFSGSSIPTSYGSMAQLLKLSLRNCSLQGDVPDLSSISQLAYLDLSWNQLTGLIPSNRLSSNISTIDLSNNFLSGPIPANFSGLPNLQMLSLENNNLNGSVPSDIWKDIVFTRNKTIVLNFQNNNLKNVSASLNPPANVSILLYGNPVCAVAGQLKIQQYCINQIVNQLPGSFGNSKVNCNPCPTEKGYEYNPFSPIPCLCAVPLEVGYRLKSPGFSDFRPYIEDFEDYLSSGLQLDLYQLSINSFIWEEGPRLRMKLKLFPNRTSLFNENEVTWLQEIFTGWLIPESHTFGPYELLNFTLGSYSNEVLNPSSSGLSKGAVAGVVLASVAVAVIFSTLITILIMRRHPKYQAASKKRSAISSLKIDGVKSFTLDELTMATNKFSSSSQVGQGGYGKVYKGILADGTVVAIKRAHEDSLQGSKEFFTEIELLSRLHHRNLVSLVGYCNDGIEQMLVYEFISSGTLRDYLSGKYKETLTFSIRLHVAMGSARGILYLHTEADPPIFHRDIKASNILLDSKFVAKVADFGLSRLAPMPDVEGNLPGHVSTVVKGTPGYVDPEYFLTRKLTDKSDVYSLGVVFLELLTGQQPISNGKNIVREVTLAYQSGLIFSIIDSRMGPYPSECMEKFVSLALRCCRNETEARPSMSEVVRELENICLMIPDSDASTTVTRPVDSKEDGTPASVGIMPTSMPFNLHCSDFTINELTSRAIPTIIPR